MNFRTYHSSFCCCLGIFGKRCFGIIFTSPSNKCNSFGTPASTLSMLAFPIGRLLRARLKIPLIIAQCSVKVYLFIGVCLANPRPCIQRFSAWKVLIFVNRFRIIPLQTKYSSYESYGIQYWKFRINGKSLSNRDRHPFSKTILIGLIMKCLVPMFLRKQSSIVSTLNSILVGRDECR